MGMGGRSRDSHEQRAKAGTEGKQEQGNRGKVLTHGTDSSKAIGAECLRTERTIAG